MYLSYFVHKDIIKSYKAPRLFSKLSLINPTLQQTRALVPCNFPKAPYCTQGRILRYNTKVAWGYKNCLSLFSFFFFSFTKKMTVFLESSVVPTKDTKLTLGKAIQVPPIGKSFIIL